LKKWLIEMPIYVFCCKNPKCKTEKFEHFSFKIRDTEELVKEIECPACEQKEIVTMVTSAAVKFTNPRGTSKWDNFSYRAGYTMDEAKEQRRFAQEHSHVGPNPYSDGVADAEHDITKFGEGIFDQE